MSDEDGETLYIRVNKRKHEQLDDTTKRQRTDEKPEWKVLYFSKKDVPNKENESDDDHELVADSSDDSYNDNDAESEDYEEYFEKDTTEVRRTIVKHVLDKFSKDQREALQKKVQQGVQEGFDLCEEMVSDAFSSLFGLRPATNLWKLGMGPTEIKKYAPMLEKLRQDGLKQKVTIQRILDANLDDKQKRELLRMFDILQSLEPYSVDYMKLESQINTIINIERDSQFTQEQLTFFSQKEAELRKIIGTDLPLKLRILNADMDDKRKAAIYEKYLLLQKTRDDSVTAAHLEEWIEEALKTPYTKMQPGIFDTEKPGECLVRLKNAFQEQLPEMDSVLEPLLLALHNRIRCPNAGSLVIGLLGSPGVGKTSVGKVIANVWGVPFQQISLGGVVDSSILDGQHSGWVGSNPGRFAKALQEMGVINGVLFLDEIDKLGSTPSGLQVQYSLLHSTDPVQNNSFNDHYLGSKLPIDLSKCLIICALNKTEGIDPALLNRMHIVKVPDYTNSQKTTIMMKRLFPDALEKAGLKAGDVILPEDTCSYIQTIVEKQIGKEGGVRGVKACIQIVLDKLSLLIHTTADEKKKLNLSFNVDIELPVKLTRDVINELYKHGDITNNWNPMYL